MVEMGVVGGGVNDVRCRLSTKMMFFVEMGGVGGLMTCVVDCQQR